MAASPKAIASYRGEYVIDPSGISLLLMFCHIYHVKIGADRSHPAPVTVSI
jgi:hypothetical protein